MITPSTIYWLTRLDGIRYTLNYAYEFLAFVSIIAIAASAVLFLLSHFTGNDLCDMFSGKSDEELDEIHSMLRRWSLSAVKRGTVGLALALLMMLSHALIPTTKEMAAIIVVPRIANSETVQQLGDGIVNLAQEWMKELAPKKGETK